MERVPQLLAISFRTDKPMTWADARRILNSLCQSLRRSPYHWKLLAVASDVSYTKIRKEERRQIQDETAQARRTRLKWYVCRKCRRSIHIHLILYCDAGESGKKLITRYLGKNRLLYETTYRKTGKWKKGQGTIKVEPVYYVQGWLNEIEGNYKYSSKKVRRERQSSDMKKTTFLDIAEDMERKNDNDVSRTGNRYSMG